MMKSHVAATLAISCFFITATAQQPDTVPADTAIPAVEVSPASTAAVRPGPAGDTVSVVVPSGVLPDTGAATAADSLSAAVTIRTVPESSQVYIDGELKGESPMTIPGLVPGKHVLQIQKKDNYVKKATIMVEAGKTLELDFELSRPGSLTLLSDPAGARVTLNGDSVGVTPVTAGKLKPGLYAVRATGLAGAVADSTVTLAGGVADTVMLEFKTGQPSDSIAVPRSQEPPRPSKIRALVSLGVFSVFTIVVFIIELAQK